MKSYLLLFIALLFACCESKKQKAEILAGPTVKSVLESIYEPTGDVDTFDHSPTVVEHSSISRLSFNKKGKLTSESKFDSKGNLEWRVVFSYDGKDNIVQQDIYKLKTLTSTIASRFDSTNRLIESSEMDAEGQMISQQTVSIDSNRNRIATTYKLARKKFVKTLECVFDSKDLVILKNIYTKELFENNDQHVFNAKGEMIHAGYSIQSDGLIQHIESVLENRYSYLEDYSNNQDLQSSEIIEYDTDGNKVETIQYFPRTSKQIITRYKYEKNNIEIVVLTGNQMISSKKILLFDDHGNLAELIQYDMGGHKQEHQRHLYEYDQLGNWIKHKTIINNKSDAVAIRQIEYF
jgi:hypothetical protein